EWQYSTNGTTWTSLGGGYSTTSAFALKSADQLRFSPAANYNGAAPALTVKLVDNSVTVTTGATVDATGGAATAYSSSAVTVNHTVTAVNDAPIASGNAILTADLEDTAAASVSTNSVLNLFGTSFDDSADQVSGGTSSATLAGIAITSYTRNAAQGEWRYSTNAGGSWTTIGASVGSNAAIQLHPTDLLEFVPAANFNGAAPALSVKLIESGGTAFTSGNTVDLSAGGSSGGSTIYSAATLTLSHSVTSVKDAPLIAD